MSISAGAGTALPRRASHGTIQAPSVAGLLPTPSGNAAGTPEHAEKKKISIFHKLKHHKPSETTKGTSEYAEDVPVQPIDKLSSASATGTLKEGRKISQEPILTHHSSISRGSNKGAGAEKEDKSAHESEQEVTDYQRENNLQMLFEKYEKEIDQMRKHFKGREEEDTILYRFLKAFDHQVEPAIKKLEGSLKWREENKFTDLVERYKDVPYDKLPHFQFVSRFYPHNENYGLDKDGNIIAITQQGKIDPIAFPINIPIEQMAEYQVPLIAKKIHHMTELSKKTGILVRGVMIIDIEGLGLKHLAPHLLEYLRHLAQMMQANFPEVLHKSFIINSPVVFKTGWRAIKQFLEPGLQNKFVICGKDYDEELYQHFTREQMPTFLHGSNETPCIVNYEADYEVKDFHGSLEIPVLVHASNDKEKRISWDFRAEKEVKYTIEFITEANDSVEVSPKKKIEANRLILGSWVLPGPGKFVLYLKTPPLVGQNTIKYKISVGPLQEDKYEEETDVPEIKMDESAMLAIKKTPSANLTMNIQLSEDVFKAKMRIVEKKMDKLDDKLDDVETKLKASKNVSDRVILLLSVIIALQMLIFLYSNPQLLIPKNTR